MSNDMEVFNPKAAGLPAELAGIFDVQAQVGDLTSGAGGGFQVISYRGSRWRIKTDGEERVLVNDAGEAMPSMEVVILKAKKDVSKIYYATKYSEGDDEAPTCFSIDGVIPDAGSTTKQSPTCATCSHNQWGSRITEAGKKAKECSDTRRIAVWVKSPCPEGVDDSAPMLLRIPPASLNDLATYGSKMATTGYPYNALVTRIGFDMNVAYPKLTFKAERPINNAEAHEIVRMMQSDTIGSMLSLSEVSIPDAPAPTIDEPIEDKPADNVTEISKPAKKTAKKPAAKKAKPAKEEKKPAPAAMDDLDSIIADMESGSLGI